MYKNVYNSTISFNPKLENTPLPQTEEQVNKLWYIHKWNSTQQQKWISYTTWVNLGHDHRGQTRRSVHRGVSFLERARAGTLTCAAAACGVRAGRGTGVLWCWSGISVDPVAGRPACLVYENALSSAPMMCALLVCRLCCNKGLKRGDLG